MQENPLILQNIINKKDKIGYSIPEVAELTGLSKSYLYKLSAKGELPTTRFGNRRVILADDLVAFCLNAQSTEEIKQNIEY